MKKLLLLILLFFISATSIASQGIKFEMELGGTYFGHKGDGVWHQKKYGPYDLNITSPSLSLGVKYNLFNMDWRAGVQYIGKYSSKGICTSSDPAYEEKKKGNDVGWPPSTFYTEGDSYGAYLTAVPEWSIFNDIKVFLELGVGYFTVSNDVKVIDWRPAIDSSMLKWGDPQLLKVSNGRHGKFTKILGFGIRKDNLSFAITMREMDNTGPLYPIISKTSITAGVRYEF
jgi:hypothetical protein